MRRAGWGRIVNVISTSVKAPLDRPGRVQHRARRGGGMGQNMGQRSGRRRHHRQQRLARCNSDGATDQPRHGESGSHRINARRRAGRHGSQSPRRPHRTTGRSGVRHRLPLFTGRWVYLWHQFAGRRRSNPLPLTYIRPSNVNTYVDEFRSQRRHPGVYGPSCREQPQRTRIFASCGGSGRGHRTLHGSQPPSTKPPKCSNALSSLSVSSCSASLGPTTPAMCKSTAATALNSTAPSDPTRRLALPPHSQRAFSSSWASSRFSRTPDHSPHGWRQGRVGF